MTMRRTSAVVKIGWVMRIPLLAAAAFCFAGCASAPKTQPLPPLAAPIASTTVTHHFGPPLAQTAAPATRPVDPAIGGDALDVRVEWSAMERLPARLPPLASSARLIADPASTQPIRTSGTLLRSVRLVGPGEIEPFLADLQAGSDGRTAGIDIARGVLPANVSAVFALFDADKPGAERRRFELTLYRLANSTDRIQVGLLAAKPPQRERALLDPIRLEGALTRMAIIVPARFASSADSRAALAVVEIRRNTGGAEHARSVAQCLKDLSAAATTMPSPASDTEGAGLAAALETLEVESSTADARLRASLVYLSVQTGAKLCGDVALVADESLLAAVARRVSENPASGTPPIDRARLAWALDSACFQEMAALQSAEKLPAELSAVLTSYAGEAGRNASSLDEIARGLQNRDQLEARLLAENLVYLEDASPASRVRAYDWLSARERAPAGYDPLGPNKDRRAALDKAMPAAATMTPGGSK